DVFLMIQHHKTTIFTDAKESSTVYELKRIVEGILKRPPEEQRLYKEWSRAPFAPRPTAAASAGEKPAPEPSSHQSAPPKCHFPAAHLTEPVGG
ncbi:putative Transcription elongation factor B polypeptide 2-like protein, partial [Naja naja]